MKSFHAIIKQRKKALNLNFSSSDVVALASLAVSAVLAYTSFLASRFQIKFEKKFECKREAYNDFYRALSTFGTSTEPLKKDFQSFLYACNKLTMFATPEITEKVKQLSDAGLRVSQMNDDAQVRILRGESAEIVYGRLNQNELYRKASNATKQYVIELQNLMFDDMQRMLK